MNVAYCEFSLSKHAPKQLIKWHGFRISSMYAYEHIKRCSRQGPDLIITLLHQMLYFFYGTTITIVVEAYHVTFNLKDKVSNNITTLGQCNQSNASI